MYVRPTALLLCVLYFSLQLAYASEEEHNIENALRVLEHLSETRKGLRALKKVITEIDDDLQRTHNDPKELPGKRALSDLAKKRRGLDLLKRILNEMESDLVFEQKRTCLVNLGGHCATETAASIADQWHYLNSPLSPGRKRRDTGLYKKLLTGKILQQ